MEQQEPYFLPLQRGPQGLVFDGKRMRKAIQRKTVDYSSPTVEYFEARIPAHFLYHTFSPQLPPEERKEKRE